MIFLENINNINNNIQILLLICVLYRNFNRNDIH